MPTDETAELLGPDHPVSVPSGWLHYASTHLPAMTLAAATGLLVLLLAAVMLRAIARAAGRAALAAASAARNCTAGVDRADLLTYLAASIATAVSSQGMWRFFRDVLTIEPALRVGLFAFIELAVLTSAVRGRQSMREHGSAGLDGAAVWALTTLSGCLSALDARSLAEAVFRLAAPLVAAWLWERGLHVERRRTTGRAGIHWTISPERILVRLRLAEPSGRSAGQVDVERYLTQLALAAKRARALEAADGRAWRVGRAKARLDAAMRRAVIHTGLAADADQQRYLLGQLGALTNAESLTTVIQLAPWQLPVPVLSGAPLSWGPAPEPRPLSSRLGQETVVGEPGATPPAQDRAPAAAAVIGPALTFGREEAPALPEPTTSAPDPETAPDEIRPTPAPEVPTPAERATITDTKILDELAKLLDVPSIRSIKSTYSIGFIRAQQIHRTATQNKNQTHLQPSIKINSKHLPESPNEDHSLHTPMQLVDVGQSSASSER